MSDLREKRVDLILQQLEELPTLPAVAMRVLEATSDDLSSARQVVELISSDPALTARILQLVHRADLGVRGEVNSIERAVVLLGFDAVRSAVLAVSVFQSFSERPSQASAGRFDRDEFWKHCVAVACCAELLAEAAGGSEIAPAEAFVCGLLHDLGKVALDAALPKSFSRVVEAADLLRGNIADVERSVIGLDHMVVGKRMAEKWQLPAVIRDVVWLHGQHPQALPATVTNPRMVNLVTLADLIVREQHLGYSGNYAFTLPRQSLVEAVGLTAPQVDEAVKKLVERIEPRARSLGLGKASTTDLYQQALAQANKELGRVSGQLASKNRRLQVRAQFFDALSRFQSELRPDVPPQVVLQAVAQTAVGVLGVSCVAAFSLPPGQTFAEALLCDGDGQIFENSLIDLPKVSVSSVVSCQLSVVSSESIIGQGDGGTAGQSCQLSDTQNPGQVVRPSRPRAGEGPVLSAGDELEWFVSMVSPRLPHDKRFWVCLEADGLCIGGVVWGASAGESQRLAPQVQEVATIASGWALALRTAQIREEARVLAEQLAEANRRLQNAQNEILRSRTMITVGEMAAGAAHEMNNPLAVISGRSQLLAQQITDPKHKASAHLIFEQAHRLSAIITELMDFAKPEPADVRPAEVADVVERALHEAKTDNDPADRSIEVTMGDVPLVLIDAAQVSAAFTEVLENAIHATDPESGQIAIHAGYDPYSSRVAVTVTDNGCGMDENTVKRAFDPFFSAKPAGRRRGLGLAKALRWIEASGGSIRLESQPGHGTRTILLLPAARSSNEVQPPVQPRKAVM
ncbi:MAG: Sporulation kinase [Phycisphaerales bacterium]|nr:Sporulation kinase [Phycisphaerales bacterium]